MRAVLARMCLTSRQVRSGWVSSNRATAPEALGVGKHGSCVEQFQANRRPGSLEAAAGGGGHGDIDGFRAFLVEVWNRFKGRRRAVRTGRDLHLDIGDVFAGVTAGRAIELVVSARRGSSAGTLLKRYIERSVQLHLYGDDGGVALQGLRGLARIDRLRQPHDGETQLLVALAG